MGRGVDRDRRCGAILTKLDETFCIQAAKMMVYVMVRVGLDVGNLGAISARSRRDLGAIWTSQGIIGRGGGG